MKSSRVNGDPIGSEREKSTARRKSGRDPGLTPTERVHKAKLLRQFLQFDGAKGNSNAFRAGYDAIRWSK